MAVRRHKLIGFCKWVAGITVNALVDTVLRDVVGKDDLPGGGAGAVVVGSEKRLTERIFSGRQATIDRAISFENNGDHVRHRSEEHTSELQSLMRISYAVFCLKKKKIHNTHKYYNQQPSIVKR